MTDYSPEFEQFWKAYPKRDGQKRGKAPAFKIWVKMSAAERLVASTDVGKRNRQRGWGKYIKDAERYLKQRGWEDEWEPNREQETDPAKPRQIGPNYVEKLASAMAMQRLCEHQMLTPWNYFGDARSGEVKGVTVAECKPCKSSSKRIMTHELRVEV